jgi:hypothetical protein
MQAGKVQFRNGVRAALVCAEIFLRVRPVPGKTSVEEQDYAVRNAPMPGFPCFQVGGRDLVVRVLVRFGRHVHHDRRAGELFDRQLIKGLAMLGEMDGRVDVCAAVFRSAVAIGRVEIALVRVGMKFDFQSEPLGRRPVECIRGKIVGKINQLAASERGVGGAQTDDASERREAAQASVKKESFHDAMLTHRAAENNARE